MTIADYFLQLPRKTFESSAAEMLTNLQQPERGVFDPAHGYLSYVGEGAQPPFTVALFLYRDGRPLLAVWHGDYEVEVPHAKSLTFYKPGSGGQMREVARSIFPVAEKKGLLFELPRYGQTVIVRMQRGGTVVAKYSWNGEKFVEDR